MYPAHFLLLRQHADEHEHRFAELFKLISRIGKLGRPEYRYMVEIKALIVHLCDFYLREGAYNLVCDDVPNHAACHMNQRQAHDSALKSKYHALAHTLFH